MTSCHSCRMSCNNNFYLTLYMKNFLRFFYSTSSARPLRTTYATQTHRPTSQLTMSGIAHNSGSATKMADPTVMKKPKKLIVCCDGKICMHRLNSKIYLLTKTPTLDRHMDGKYYLKLYFRDRRSYIPRIVMVAWIRPLTLPLTGNRRGSCGRPPMSPASVMP